MAQTPSYLLPSLVCLPGLSLSILVFRISASGFQEGTGGSTAEVRSDSASMALNGGWIALIVVVIIVCVVCGQSGGSSDVGTSGGGAELPNAAGPASPVNRCMGCSRPASGDLCSGCAASNRPGAR